VNNDTADIDSLAMAALSYMDWELYVEEGDDDGAEAAFESYLQYRQRLISEILINDDLASLRETEDYVTGMVAGYMEAIRS